MRLIQWRQDLRWVSDTERVVIIMPPEQEKYILKETPAVLWQLLQSGLTREQILRNLSALRGSPAEETTFWMESVLNNWAEIGLIQYRDCEEINHV